MKKTIIFFAVIIFQILAIKANAQKGIFFSEATVIKFDSINVDYLRKNTNPVEVRKLFGSNNINFTVALGYKFFITDKFGIISKISTPIKFKFEDKIYSYVYKKFISQGERYEVSYIPISLGIYYNIFKVFKTEADFSYGIRRNELRTASVIYSWFDNSPSWNKFSVKGVFSHSNQEVFVGLDLMNFLTPDGKGNMELSKINSITFGYRYNFIKRTNESRNIIRQF
jgi:hypothetical protein